MPFFTESIPPYLLKNDRPADEHFVETERLYIRCLKEQIDEEKDEFIIATLDYSILELEEDIPRFPNTSVNRGKYCRPRDVLLPIFLDWGVVYVKVKHTKLDYEHPPTGEKLTLKPVHDPLEMNFSHAEIQVFQINGESKERLGKGLKRSMAKVFKGELGKYAKVFQYSKLTDAEWSRLKPIRREKQAEIERALIPTEV